MHHALFAYVRAGAYASIDGADGKPGFRGLAPIGANPNIAPSGPLGGWAVGASPRFLPEGLALPMGKGSDFVIQMHFHPSGKVEREKSTVGIYFADKAPERTLRNLMVPGLFGIGSLAEIPAGERNHVIERSTTLPVDVKVYFANPHAHYLAKEFKATATLPDGSTKPLLWIQDWDFNWQDGYNYKQPVILPKGTRIDVRITYDNSATNPRNPSNPPQRVWWGEQSTDEMGTIGFGLIPVRRRGRGRVESVRLTAAERDAAGGRHQRNAAKGRAESGDRPAGQPGRGPRTSARARARRCGNTARRQHNSRESRRGALRAERGARRALEQFWIPCSASDWRGGLAHRVAKPLAAPKSAAGRWPRRPLGSPRFSTPPRKRARRGPRDRAAQPRRSLSLLALFRLRCRLARRLRDAMCQAASPISACSVASPGEPARGSL